MVSQLYLWKNPVPRMLCRKRNFRRTVRCVLVSLTSFWPYSCAIIILRIIRLVLPSSRLNFVSSWRGTSAVDDRSVYISIRPQTRRMECSSILNPFGNSCKQFTMGSPGCLPVSWWRFLHFKRPLGVEGHTNGWLKFLKINCGTKCWYSGLVASIVK